MNAAEKPASAESGTRNWLLIRGARTHNLQNLDLDIPLHCLCVITGVSGSGKSSLAIDTIAAEGQSRFLEALSLGQQRKLPRMSRAVVDLVQNLPPTCLVGQATQQSSPRSTLATVSDLWPVIQALASQFGTAHCPCCDAPLTQHRRQEIVAWVRTLPARTKLMLLAPLEPNVGSIPVDHNPGDSELADKDVVGRGLHLQASDWKESLERIAREGYVRIRADDTVLELSELPPHRPMSRLAAVVDRLITKDELPPRFEESLAAALALGDGRCLICVEQGGHWEDREWSTVSWCAHCREVCPPLTREHFQWRHPAGQCAACAGSGVLTDHLVNELRSQGTVAAAEVRTCDVCHGTRLSPMARALRLGSLRMDDFLRLSVNAAERQVNLWQTSLSAAMKDSRNEEKDSAMSNVVSQILSQLQRRFSGLVELGLGYLELWRSTATLSRGELQRVRLATALGEQSQGLCYVFDEPTSGLHAQDIQGLVEKFRELCRLGNSVIAVEHTPELIAAADWIIDVGPGAGKRGGRILATASRQDFLKSARTATADMLRLKTEPLSDSRTATSPTLITNVVTPIATAAATASALSTRESVKVCHVTRHNLQLPIVEFPTRQLVGVAGISGSGKSTLIHEVLVPLARRSVETGVLSQRQGTAELVEFGGIETVAVIPNRLPGRSSAACPGTLAGVWTEIRQLYARTREARRLGWSAGRFSYRHPQSGCERCRGAGQIREQEAHGFLLTSVCPECRGRRYQRALQAVTYRGVSIADLLERPVDAAAELFAAFERISRPLQTLQELAMGYLPLGQPGDTLSGGELQRLHLAKFLRTSNALPALVVMDEPTAGLHHVELNLLVKLLRQIVAAGHSVLVVEHRLQLLREVDWLLELGPGSGPDGGRLVYAGPPSGILAVEHSPTGRALWASPHDRS